MISTRPGTIAHRALVLIAETPGELTASDIGRALWPLPKRTTPYTSSTDRREWLAGLALLGADRTRRAGRLLGRLVEAGLLARTRPPHLAPHFRRLVRRDGWMSAVQRSHPGYPVVTELRAYRAMLRRVHMWSVGPDPIPMAWRDWVDRCPGGRADTSRQRRVLAELSAWGVVVMPMQRTLTPAGLALVNNTQDTP